MTRLPARLGTVATVVVALAASLPAGEAALTLADLAAYRAALSAGETKGEHPVRVTFRELWDHPATYQGRRVQVEGRVVRRFRQGSFGTFPPLEEAWTVSAASDPFCLVFPETSRDPKAPGSAGRVRGEVRFVGTFLRMIEYQGGDGPRLAPLIVGPAEPAAVASATARRPGPARGADARPTRLDWMIGAVVAALVVLVLACQHLRRPVRRILKVEDTPAPLFDDTMASAGVPGPSDSR
jgi:hypothetical protein